jgi:hypothetical protein
VEEWVNKKPVLRIDVHTKSVSKVFDCWKLSIKQLLSHPPTIFGQPMMFNLNFLDTDLKPSKKFQIILQLFF